MASPVALITLISLVLFAGVTEARKDPGDYWHGVAARNDQALLEAIQRLVHVDSTLSNKEKITTAGDRHTSNKKDSVAATNKKFVTDFEPRPNVSAYGGDSKSKRKNTFMKDFEPRPNVSAYGDDAKLKKDEDNTSDKSFAKDFKKRPSATAYSN